MKPTWLDANQPPRFFAGGAAIARLRDVPPPERNAPEDWVGSATPLFGEREVGLSRLSDGTRLVDAMAADPEAFFGPAHAGHFGGDPGLLVKLLDAGQRLPVHAHPNREFARRHLDCPYGKTEAWVVAEVHGPAPLVYLGFRDDVDADELADMVRTQATDALLGALNPVPVAPGDAILVPAGTPHAIGAGVFVVELQEPTDLSVLMEWDGFDIDGAANGHLGLGFELALDAVDRSRWDAGRLGQLWTRRPPETAGREQLLPAAADAYFRAERLAPPGRVALEPGFSIVVALQGHGTLSTQHGGTHTLRRGDTVLVPHAAGHTAIEGDLEVIRCRPPEPAATRDAR